MATWQKKLQSWVSSGLLTPEQHESILKYESAQSSAPSNWVLYGFVLLGIGVLGTGIIALISANWEAIPVFVKLTTDILLMILVAAGIYRSQSKSNGTVTDALIFLIMLLTLASLGLVSQVYNTSGKFHDAILIVGLATLPLTLFSHYRFLPYLWTYSFLTALLFRLFGSNWGEHFDTITLIVFSSCFLSGTIAVIFSKLKHFVIPLFSFALGLWILLVCYFDFRGDLHTSSYTLNIINIVFIFSSFALLKGFKKISNKQFILLTWPFTGFLFLILTSDYRVYDLLRAIITIFSGIGLSLFFASVHHKKLFNFVTLLVMLRFLGIFFEVFGSLLATGIGLIIAGLIILLTAYLWYKTKDKLAGLVQRSL